MEWSSSHSGYADHGPNGEVYYHQSANTKKSPGSVCFSSTATSIRRQKIIRPEDNKRVRRTTVMSSNFYVKRAMSGDCRTPNWWSPNSGYHQPNPAYRSAPQSPVTRMDQAGVVLPLDSIEPSLLDHVLSDRDLVGLQRTLRPAEVSLGPVDGNALCGTAAVEAPVTSCCPVQSPAASRFPFGNHTDCSRCQQDAFSSGTLASDLTSLQPPASEYPGLRCATTQRYSRDVGESVAQAEKLASDSQSFVGATPYLTDSCRSSPDLCCPSDDAQRFGQVQSSADISPTLTTVNSATPLRYPYPPSSDSNYHCGDTNMQWNAATSSALAQATYPYRCHSCVVDPHYRNVDNVLPMTADYEVQQSAATCSADSRIAGSFNRTLNAVGHSEVIASVSSTATKSASDSFTSESPSLLHPDTQQPCRNYVDCSVSAPDYSISKNIAATSNTLSLSPLNLAVFDSELGGFRSSCSSGVSSTGSTPPLVPSLGAEGGAKTAYSVDAKTLANSRQSTTSGRPREKSKRMRLYQFLIHHLQVTRRTDLLEWINRDELTFRVNRGDQLSALWGAAIDRPRMTYAGVAHTLRLYRRESIHGVRPMAGRMGSSRVYRFNPDCAQVMSCIKAGEAADNSTALWDCRLPIDYASCQLSMSHNY